VRTPEAVLLTVMTVVSPPASTRVMVLTPANLSRLMVSVLGASPTLVTVRVLLAIFYLIINVCTAACATSAYTRASNC
jgi:hypothetical protein